MGLIIILERLRHFGASEEMWAGKLNVEPAGKVTLEASVCDMYVTATTVSTPRLGLKASTSTSTLAIGVLAALSPKFERN